MAATRLIALHINKGKTLAQCLEERTDYSENPEKTNNGKYVTGYECDPKTADEEFLLAKRQYQHITGRQQKSDVIAYQIRQSFKPGEITPEEANEVGRETAMRFLKGNHAFIVATHTDRAHIHNHIIFNSTTLDCTHKFRDFLLSGLAVRRVSDLVCAEHGLSIITPKPYSERQKCTEYPKRVSQRDVLREAIDEVLRQKPKSFEVFLERMADKGYAFKDGKHLAFQGLGQKRFIRLHSLGKDYSEENIKAVIAGKAVKHRSRDKTSTQFHLLIDIESKLAEGKTGGYERWAKKFNRKEAARTVCLLKEKGLDSYDDLKSLTDQLSIRFSELSETIKTAEKRMTEIGALQTHINNYSKTRKVYEEYRKSGYSKKFFEEHRDAILLHKAAKEAFNQLGGKELPSRQALSAEFYELLSKKKKSYAEYRQVKKDMQEYLIAKQTVENILGMDRKKEEEKNEKQQESEER